MNWGLRIALVTGGFVAFMTFMVVKAFQQNFDLVTEDYYSKELAYQEQIDKSKNQQALNEKPSILTSGENVVINFPSQLRQKNIEGEILFFCPSDEKKDRRVKISSQNGVHVVPRSLLKNGYYRVQLDYRSEGKAFYYEDSVVL